MVDGGRIEPLWGGHAGKLLRWSLMSAALFWMLVYRLSSAASAFPDFVYVHF
ncbi:MAG: hypothetical protein J0L64_06515 [Acidobacteria bacterium]|nr:hypothetical protein [Acidobacteriota bacterium]